MLSKMTMMVYFIRMIVHNGNKNKVPTISFMVITHTYTNPLKHPFALMYLSLYGMAHNINSIITITTVQFLSRMEPHIPTLCMTTTMMMLPMTTRMMIMMNVATPMIMPMETPLI